MSKTLVFDHPYPLRIQDVNDVIPSSPLLAVGFQGEDKIKILKYYPREIKLAEVQ